MTVTQTFLDLAYNWPIGTIWVGVMALVVFVVVFAVLYGLFCLIDSSGVPTSIAPGRVVSKRHTDSHTVYQATTVGNSTTVIPITIPESWSVALEVNGQDGTLEVDKEFFDSVISGSHVQVTYGYGRFSGGMYPKAATLVSR